MPQSFQLPFKYYDWWIVLRSAVGMTHGLRSDLWWTIPLRIYLVNFGIPLAVKLSVSAIIYPRCTATVYVLRGMGEQYCGYRHLVNEKCPTFLVCWLNSGKTQVTFCSLDWIISWVHCPRASQRMRFIQLLNLHFSELIAFESVMVFSGIQNSHSFNLSAQSFKCWIWPVVRRKNIDLYVYQHMQQFSERYAKLMLLGL